MKKNYLMLVCLVLMVVSQATAQNFTIDQLYGKWKFTADVEFTDAATQAHKETLSGDCDAVISKDVNYIAKIVGFAGSQNQQNVNMIGAKNGQDMLKINNLNNPQLWNSLYLANENGDNPYGIWENGTEVVKSYGPVYYNVYATEGLITIPDFTVVTLNGYSDPSPTIIAKYTNVKMTLVEAEVIEVADISGEWHFKAGVSEYSTMAGSAIPVEFDVTLVKGDDNREYDATFAIEGFEDITLSATFNGNILSIAYDSTYIDTEKGIRFANMNGSKVKKGVVDFKQESEDVFSLYSGFSFVVDSIGKNKAGDADSVFVKLQQWYMDGALKKSSSEAAIDWAGVYNVSLNDPETDLYIKNAAGIDWPNEFQFEVTYFETADAYYVTKIFGMDIANLNNGGLKFTPAEDGKSAVISTGYLMTVEQGAVYLVLRDMNMTANGIVMNVGENGEMSILGLCVATLDNNNGSSESLNASYSNLVVAKEGAEEEAPAFDWAGDYVLKAGTVDVYNKDVEFPAEFNVNIVYFDGTAYGMESYYYISTFMGYNIGSTPIKLTIAEDGKSAEMSVGGMCGAIEPGKLYYKIYDMNATTSPVKMTLNEDGTISIADFFIKVLDYTTNEETAGAFYKNVTLVDVENLPEEPAFDWAGDYVLKAGTVDVYNNDVEFPAEFNVNITYFDGTAYGMESYYYIGTFMGYNIGSTPIKLTIAEDGKSAEMSVGGMCGAIEPGKLYYKIYDMNATASPVKMTLNEDGTISIADFFIKVLDYTTNEETAGAFYKNVTLEQGTTGIEDVVAGNAVIKGIFDMQGRKVEEITAPGLYIVNGKKVIVK